MFLIVFLAMLGLQCSPYGGSLPAPEPPDHSESSPAKDIVRLSDTASERAGIKVEEVKSQKCKTVLGAMGKVLAPQPQTAIVSHAFPARVAEIHVKIGDWVEKRQPLVTLESHEVGIAKAEFYKARADLELTKLTLAREERLLGNGIGIKKNHLAAEAAYKIAQADAEAAEKTLHVLGFTEEQVKEIADTHQINPTITLYSPIAGKVVAHKAVLGAPVDQSTEILTIIDPTLLWVDAEIYEKDIAKIKLGQKVEIMVPAYPGEVFRGKVSYIGDIVNEETRTITVRAEVKNDQYRLKPGMFADVEIVLNEGRQIPVVPLAAVLEEGDLKFVFVKEEKACFRRRQVETGEVDGDYWPILKGLEAGEEVVVEGNQELKSKLREEVLKAAHVH